MKTKREREREKETERETTRQRGGNGFRSGGSEAKQGIDDGSKETIMMGL
jgi:hypothetical protein